MTNQQYTIRAVPPAIDQALRQKARRESKSLNTVALEALALGLDLGREPFVNHDFDAFIGCWEEDPGFDAAMQEFSKIDEDFTK